MQSFKQHLIKEEQLLTEADTSKATNTEMAICVGYNMQYKGLQLEEAAKAAGVLEDKGKWEGLLELGQKIAKSSGGKWGDILTHSGKDSSEKNHSNWPGTDSTSKSDIRGDSGHMISLKKTGAPIMSGKGDKDASGVFQFALKHRGFAEEGKYAEALNILQEKMGDSARNQQIVRAGAGKSEFADWYATQSDRVSVIQKGMGEKKVEQYLRAELAMFGIPKRSNRNQQKLIDKMKEKKVTPITKDEINAYGQKFAGEEGSEWEIGSGASAQRTAKRKGTSGKDVVMVGHDHIEDLLKNPEKELSGSKMKEQIADVVETSMESKEWKKVLDDAFATDSELRQWVMYEAGSGYGKFTGGGKEGSWTKYKPGMRSVANYMVVWNKDGSIKYEGDMVDYAQSNGDKVKNLDISYKSSGRSSYIKLGLKSSYEHELPMIQEELTRLNAQYMLNEGIFRDMFTSARDKMKMLADKVKQALKIFWEKVIMRFVNGLKDLLREGLDKFAEAVGVTGKVTIGNA